MASDRTLTFANGPQLAKLIITKSQRFKVGSTGYKNMMPSMGEDVVGDRSNRIIGRKGESESREKAMLDECTGAETAASHMPSLPKTKILKELSGRMGKSRC